jgi:hypothetical protein
VGPKSCPIERAARASRSVGLLAPLTAMFAGLPPSSLATPRRDETGRLQPVPGRFEVAVAVTGFARWAVQPRWIWIRREAASAEG